MSSFKVYIRKNSKNVITQFKLNDFNQFSDLRQKIFDCTQKPIFARNNENLLPTDKFKLVFGDEKDISFIPEDLSDGLFDNESFNYFKSQIISHGVTDGKYKLYIEKVDSLPEFKKKGNNEILEENLKKYWNLTMNDIASELNFMKLTESNNTFEKMKAEKKENDEKLNSIKHENIICSNCFTKDFSGKRFICAECENYNLCQECEKILHEKEIHQREHVLIQINKNLGNENLKYNNIIGKYQKEFQNIDENFKFDFIVVNNPENDLHNCYILPIRYGEQYLTCESYKINDKVKRGMNTKISLNVKSSKKLGILDGYFRMFTPKGLPLKY